MCILLGTTSFGFRIYLNNVKLKITLQRPFSMDHCRAVIIILPLPQVLICSFLFQKSCIDWRKIGVFDSSKSLAKSINAAFLIINFLTSGRAFDLRYNQAMSFAFPQCHRMISQSFNNLRIRKKQLRFIFLCYKPFHILHFCF